MAIGGPQLKGLQVLVLAPPSERARALACHLGSVESWDCKQVHTAEDLRSALDTGTWDAVVYAHDPSAPDAEARLRSAVADAGQRPLIVVGEDPGGSAVAAMFRLGAADFAA